MNQLLYHGIIILSFLGIMAVGLSYVNILKIFDKINKKFYINNIKPPAPKRVISLPFKGNNFTLISNPSRRKMNVLLIGAQDLRGDFMDHYGGSISPHFVKNVQTPNLDTLASKSLVLRRSYVQYPLCAPSRTSILTGRRPDTTGVYDLYTHFREHGQFTTLPKYFKDHGYYTTGVGRIFHSHLNDPQSWTSYLNTVPFAQTIHWRKQRYDFSWKTISAKENNQFPMPDDVILDFAIELLQKSTNRLKKHGEPFFLAIGFQKPHMPFVFPERFMPENISMPRNPFSPKGMPTSAWSRYPELRRYKDIRDSGLTGNNRDILSESLTLQIRRAYFGAVSYMDSLVGEVIQQVENRGLTKDTIIAFWSDHGFLLGEHNQWCKHSNFDLALHAPWMISIPGLTDNGIINDNIVEHIDLFPTLVDAAGLTPLPLCPVHSNKVPTCREGSSLLPLIYNPNREWKKAAFSQFTGGCRGTGYSVRTKRFRYTEWTSRGRDETCVPLNISQDGVIGRELYDYDADPEGNNNIAGAHDYKAYQVHLKEILHAGWRADIAR